MAPDGRSGQERSRLEHFFWPGRDPQRAGAAFGRQRTALRRQAFINSLEASGFNWQVFAVAASGFFTDSYNLFASNVILPALAFVYWNGPNHDMALAFNLATLGASAVGQLVFGMAADLFGRRSLYGIELIIVIISTVGLLQCSPGFTDVDQHTTWNIDVWIIFWRCIMGFGIGAEYPLSACIAAEWSSTKSRGRMMSAVFLMQPLGQLCAYGAGLTALRAFGNTQVEIDKLWRYVIGIGAVPTLLALAFRLYMPESGRYTFDVRENLRKTDTDTLSTHSTQLDAVSDSDVPGPDIPGPDIPHGNLPEPNALSPNIPESSWNQFNLSELWNYVYHEGYWRYLVGSRYVGYFWTSPSVHGLGFNNPSTLAKLWSSQHLQYPSNPPWWLKTSDVLNTTIGGELIVDGMFVATGEIAEPLIHDVLQSNMLHAVYTVSIASILGSILMIVMINHFDRKDMLTGTFIVLGIVLIIVCASFNSLFHQGGKHIVLIVFWMVISFLFQFGPNTITFIIPAEVFPTRYRCSFYGIAAAWGKIGAVLVQIVILQKERIAEPNSTSIRWLLLGFAFCMFFGALVSYTCLPHVQVPNTKTAPEVWLTMGGKSFTKRPPPFVNVPLEDLPPPPRRRTKPQDEEQQQEMEEIPNGHAR